MPRETWYVLEDGSTVDPNDVAPDKSGALIHKSGVAVAIGPHGPRSRGVDAPLPAPSGPFPENEKSVMPDGMREMVSREIAKAKEDLEARQMTAEKPRRGYKTR